jgi:hypothetical protein
VYIASVLKLAEDVLSLFGVAKLKRGKKLLDLVVAPKGKQESMAIYSLTVRINRRKDHVDDTAARRTFVSRLERKLFERWGNNLFHRLSRPD